MKDSNINGKFKKKNSKKIKANGGKYSAKSNSSRESGDNP